jgi:hypothetical protein
MLDLAAVAAAMLHVEKVHHAAKLLHGRVDRHGAKPAARPPVARPLRADEEEVVAATITHQ